jgi:hypothetical protein
MTSTTQKIDSAKAEVLRQRGILAEWETKRGDAIREAAELEARAGAEILDGPDMEDEIDLRLASLQRRARSAEKAIAAQRPRVLSAESKYLAAEADDLDATAREAEEVVAGHHTETQRLLGLLEAHEGPHISEYEHRRSISSLDVLVLDSRPVVVPKSRRLVAEATLLRHQVLVLRELAAGRDPEPLIRSWNYNSSSDAYADCVTGADALVRAPHFLAAVERAREVVAELEALPAELEAEIEEFKTKLRRGGGEEAQAAESAIRRREHRLSEIDAELVAARADLEALTVVEVSDDEDEPAARRRLLGRRPQVA